MRISRLFLTISLTAFTTALLAGCEVGPDFQSPPAPFVGNYEATPLPSSTESSDDPSGAPQKFLIAKDISATWWEIFHSAPLNELIQNALKVNPDIAAAQAALRVAQENTRASEGALFPQLSGDFSSVRQKTSSASNNNLAPSSIYTLHTASLNVSYGLDLFGGTRRQIEELSAQEDYQRFELEATYLTLTSNIVTTAIQEASLRGQINATNKIADEQTHQLELVKQQFELGGVAKSAVLLQQAALQQTKATLPELKRQLAVLRHQLSVLGGQFPNKEPGASFDLSSLHLPQDLPVSLPSKLVAQRPDVQEAEANLHVASAAIGVAEANRLPQIALNADIGSVATKLQKLFTPGGGLWAFGASGTETLFDAGTLEHEEDAAKAAYDVATAQYRKTVLTAFQNVADALHALQSDAETLKAQVEYEKASADSLQLAQAQFEAGATNYLTLLIAEETEQQAKIALVKAEAQRYSDTAALFQALGGGWWNRHQDITQNTSPDPLDASPVVQKEEE